MIFQPKPSAQPELSRKDRDLMIELLKQASFHVTPNVMTGGQRVDDRSWYNSGGGMMAGDGYRRPELIDHLLRFAALVAAHEREQCALSVEAVDLYNEYDPAYSFAAAIRARGEVTAPS